MRARHHTQTKRRWLPIYGDDVIGRYHNAPYGSLPPHCFQEAEDAFSSLQKTRRNQAVVICGESGAGKTETTKLMLHYLAVVSKRQSARDAKLKGTTQSTGPTIAERMVASNPLFDAVSKSRHRCASSPSDEVLSRLGSRRWCDCS